MATTPKPLRKEIKKRVKHTHALYKEKDAKGFKPQEVKKMKKEDRVNVKRIVKKLGK